ncbi:hypothetical protein C0Z19_25890 [Trinickia soli]|uniref:Uncharacterized protein n=1 Tax=Trinickia soli TaxID=380675 RepID=A0A2N7VGZ8_9BURK|nr:hypothetical protein CIW54_13900 [Paraburkholderia sp. T12-10]PMS16433.1 hypothetical protein C0Z19_25890 [Trinickia soli]
MRLSGGGGDVSERLPGLDRILRGGRSRRTGSRSGSDDRSAGRRSGGWPGIGKPHASERGEGERERDGATRRTCCHGDVTRGQARLEMAFGRDQNSLRQ